MPFEVDEIFDFLKSYRIDKGVSVRGNSSPGHTRDFTVYWIPERGVLVASEAVGCDGVPEFLVDYDIYLSGIETFLVRNWKVLCTGYRFVLTEGDVAMYLREARKSSRGLSKARRGDACGGKGRGRNSSGFEGG